YMTAENKTKRLLYQMLTENTGTHFLDSGGAYGRHWETNQLKTIKDFEKEPPVYVNRDCNTYDVSVFHYLNSVLTLDALCDVFNKKFRHMADWESDIYGVSKKAKEWLDSLKAEYGESQNTYNGEQSLSQTLQYTPVNIANKKYILVQIHNGCDVRGGYTDAKLFEWPDYSGFGMERAFLEGAPRVYGMVDGKQCSTSYDGINITDDDTNEIVQITKDSKIDLWLSE
ncbi:MAG: hypothetical protein KGJ07_09625, partial [Patescibacteria group bacterium]|nr:hypothetical protein [Patescibacteria group bacterium]